MIVAAEKRGCYVDNDLISLLGSIVMMAEMTRIICNTLNSLDLPAPVYGHGKCSLNMVKHRTSSLSIML